MITIGSGDGVLHALAVPVTVQDTTARWMTFWDQPASDGACVDTRTAYLGLSRTVQPS